MTVFSGSSMHEDGNGVKTSAEWTGSKWKLNVRTEDGDDPTIGAKADAAALTGDASVVALLKLLRPNKTSVTFHASATRTATGSGSNVDVSAYRRGILIVNVTAASGTDEELRVTFEVRDPVGATNYAVVAVSDAITTTGAYAIPIPEPVGLNARIGYTIAGTSPSFTFSAAAIMEV